MKFSDFVKSKKGGLLINSNELDKLLDDYQKQESKIYVIWYEYEDQLDVFEINALNESQAMLYFMKSSEYSKYCKVESISLKSFL